mmetsp:Transcript_129240/g.374182  ORF Transcript_129240/g.374182 Transcript_129240/m.374182 type:complete len:212 (-) Transcript_129240:1152-1787(-)
MSGGGCNFRTSFARLEAVGVVSPRGCACADAARAAWPQPKVATPAVARKAQPPLVHSCHPMSGVGANKSAPNGAPAKLFDSPSCAPRKCRVSDAFHRDSFMHQKMKWLPSLDMKISRLFTTKSAERRSSKVAFKPSRKNPLKVTVRRRSGDGSVFKTPASLRNTQPLSDHSCQPRGGPELNISAPMGALMKQDDLPDWIFSKWLDVEAFHR